MLTFAHHPILLRQPSHDRVSGFELKWAAQVLLSALQAFLECKMRIMPELHADEALETDV